MNQIQFDQQIQRLVSNFGKTSYTPERAILIWREVKDLSVKWFETTIDKFIGKERYAPLLPQFQAEISEERERVWKIEKAQHGKEAHQFFVGSYQPDDARHLCQTIIKRLADGVSESDYKQFIEHLKHTARSSHKTYNIRMCEDCGNSGLVFDEHNRVFRCYCEHGQRQSKAYGVFMKY